MKTSITQISMLIIFLLLTACQKDSLVNDLSLKEKNKIETRVKKKHAVPFHATFVSTVSVFPPQPNEEVCGMGAPVFNLLQTLEGNATHMGLISGSISSCIDPTTSPPTIFNQMFTLIAANGDELYLAASGEPGGVFDITGGSGRFSDATGTVRGVFQRIEGSFPPSFQSSLSGDIQY